MRKVMVLLGVICLTIPSIPANAQQERPWAEPLRRQMLHDENCVVAFFGEVAEHNAPGRYVVRTRVTCEDQRVFTAEQNGGPEQPFRIIACNREGPSC